MGTGDPEMSDSIETKTIDRYWWVGDHEIPDFV